MKRLCLILTILLLSATAVQAQKKRVPASPPGDKTHVLLILDCSSSMWDKWQSDSKIKVTQAVLLKFMDSLSHQNDVEFAMRVFGHLNKSDRGTRLEVPFEYDNNYKIKSKIKTLVPQGGCTATTALSNAVGDFPQSASSRNIILIITDGLDDCGDDLCQAARQVQTSGMVVKTFIVGIGDKRNFKSDLGCAGKFFHVPYEENFIKTLYNIYAMAEQQAEVTLAINDRAGKAYETTAPVVFYDRQTGMPRFQTIYTCNSKSSPDTLKIDPLIDYNVVFLTNPPQTISNVKLSSDRLNQLSISAEQGFLRIRFDGRRLLFAIPEYTVSVRDAATRQLVNTQAINENAPYVTGRYTVEIHSLPTIVINDVEIAHNSSTDLTIPSPGLAVINKPKGQYKGHILSIDETSGNATAIHTLDEEKQAEHLAMMPGEYIIMLQDKDDFGHKTIQTRQFKIEPAQQTNINF